MSNYKISHRLGFLVAVLLLGTIAIGFAGIFVNNYEYQKTSFRSERAKMIDGSIDIARNAQVNFKIQIQEWKNILIRGQNNQANFDKYRQAFVEQGKQTQQLLQILQTLFHDLGLDSQAVVKVQVALSELEKRYLNSLQQYDISDNASLHRVDQLVTGLDREPTEMMDVLVEDTLNYMQKISSSAAELDSKDYQFTSILLWGGMVLSVLFSLVITWLVLRSILLPLKKAVVIAQKVTEGDLFSFEAEQSDTPSHRCRDEVRQLLATLQKMSLELKSIVFDVRQGAESVSGAAAQIASSTDDLSARTESQASALQETAASIEQLAATVHQNSDNAFQANKLAQTTAEQAKAGGQLVTEVVKTMSAIDSSSKQVSDIIEVINTIAFQTNILALNAAVEAARAGEQGRGFAVVAGEVRNLAQRSADAAKEIKVLIDHSVHTIHSGNQLVEQAGASIQAIVEGIYDVSNLVHEISTASQEQSLGIDQANIAVSQMEQTTQQNVALVEESAAASKSLQVQAQQLLETVSFFTLTQPNMIQTESQNGSHTNAPFSDLPR